MARGTILKFPNLLAQCPFKFSQNPLYATAGPESSAWLEEYFEGDKLRHFKDARTDLLINYTYPYVNRESFRLCADNLNLLFVLDDISDAQDGKGARQTQDTFLRALNGEPCEDNVVSQMTKDFMRRHASRFHPVLMRRFLQHNQEYIDSVVREAEYRERGEILSMEEYRKLRRDNSGVILAFDFIEVSLGFVLPDEVRNDKTFQQIYYSALDLVNFSNDILSYKVEHAQGLAGCNVLTVFMHNNQLSLQEAVDHAGVMYQKLLRDMVQGKETLRSFGPVVDSQLHSFIRGLEDWVVGSLHWSFQSQRYFGDDAGQSHVLKGVKIVSP